MESQNTNLVLGLKRISDSATKYRFIKLEGKEQVKVILVEWVILLLHVAALHSDRAKLSVTGDW